MGGDLACPDDPNVLEFVQNQRPCRFTAWVGLTKKNGEWEWINGKKLKKDMTGLMEQGGDLENRTCAHILLQGGLMSRPDDGILPSGWSGQPKVQAFLCEWKKNSAPNQGNDDSETTDDNAKRKELK
jgi:hypothetical protein